MHQLYEELTIGNTYTVVEQIPCNCGCGNTGYDLEEVESKYYYFYSKCFIPVSDIDEGELSEEQCEEIRKRQLIKI